MKFEQSFMNHWTIRVIEKKGNDFAYQYRCNFCNKFMSLKKLEATHSTFGYSCYHCGKVLSK
jgi:predicted SprT family Zn-dependent metalloprotease